MKELLNKYAYILIALVPVTIYIVSYCLFEINAESSLKIKAMIVEAARNHTVSPVSTIIEYKSRILWLSSGLLSIIAYFIALTWSVIIACHCCRSGHLIKMAGIGLAVMALTLLQIDRADSKSAMYNNIFDTTYQALKASTIITEFFLQKVFIIISTINVLAAVTPAFILIAICSTISTPIEANALKPEFFIRRMNYLKQGIMVGSMVLLFGIIHMVAWMQWPTAMLDETILKKAALNSFDAVSQYWGISFTLLLICLYASATIYWRAQTQAALLAMQSDIDVSKWLADNGFNMSWNEHAVQLGTMLMPFLAGSFGAGKDLLSLN